MRTPLVAGNWKMNKTVIDARDLVAVMKTPLSEIVGVEKVLCPPFIAIPLLSEMLKGSGVGLGAQNLYWEAKGAFTGEIAPGMPMPTEHRAPAARSPASTSPAIAATVAS